MVAFGYLHNNSEKEISQAASKDMFYFKQLYLLTGN